MKKVYIAGCGGMLGRAFYEVWSKYVDVRASDKNVNEEWLSYLDFNNAEAYKLEVARAAPDLLIHLGALTNLEYCESNKDDTYRANTLSVETAVSIANAHSIPIMYISTAGIFDGKQPLYDDWDLPNPLGAYGRSKYMGERFVVENANEYYIFRAGWMMGGGKKDKKFIKKIYDQLKKSPKEIFVVDDKDGTPTYTKYFAKNAYEVVSRGYQGLHNMVCGGETSRLEVARFMVSYLNLQVKVTPVGSRYFRKEYWAERPPSERLVNTKLRLRNIDFMRSWKVGLAEYLDSGELDEA